MWFELVSLSIICCLVYLLLFSKSPLPKYWEEYGIQEIDSSAAASTLEIILGKKSILHRDEYAYEKLGSSGKYCGMAEFPSPVILIKDLEIIKKIFIKDFDYFMNRRDFFPLVQDSILTKDIPHLKGEKWKNARNSISPNFTTGRMRKLMEHFNNVGLEWIEMLRKDTSKNGGSTVVQVLKTVNQFSVEVIATSVFGMRSGSIGNPNAIFYKMANRIAEPGIVNMIKLNLSPRFPKLFTKLGIDVLDTEAISFFENILRQSMEARLSGSVEKRNDFQQLLIDTLKDTDGLGQYLTKDMIVANSIVFFQAGAQTTSGFISFAMYCLAAYPDVQNRLREEVDRIVSEDGKVDYDELGELQYMEMFTSEVLRLYPAAFRLEREANKDYHDKETGLFVSKGTTVVIPVKSIHYDPKYYKNPEKFDPENFSGKRKAERSPYAYMPFGIGPRQCILSLHGMRFALVESKAVIAQLVHNFRIEPTEKTPLPVSWAVAGLQIFLPKELQLRLTARK